MVSILDYGAVGDGVADDTAAFIAACASGKYIVVPFGTYKLDGNIPFLSGTVLYFERATINITVNGEINGFTMDGVSNCWMLGVAEINGSYTVPGTHGAHNNMVKIGSEFYGEPSKTYRCGIKGSFIFDSIGQYDMKPIQIVGWAEDIILDGITVTGKMNYAFGAHWSGNGGVGVLPTKTWHPHNITIRDYKVIARAGANIVRGFTLSACGKVTIENCKVEGANNVAFNLFCGDYGFAYNQNSPVNMHYTIRDCDYNGPCRALIVDGYSSGINGSSYWNGADHRNSIVIDNLQGSLTTGNLNSVNIAGVDNLSIRNLYVNEDTSGNTEYSFSLVGVKRANIQGKIVSQQGVTIKDCGIINWDMDLIQITPTPNAASSCMLLTAVNETVTVNGAVAVGDTSITINSASGATLAGGILRYNDGANNHEMMVESLIYSGATQTFKISPAPIAIPNNATLTLMRTIKGINIGPVVLEGARFLVQMAGNATAKVRNVSCNGTFLIKGGVVDIGAQYVDGLSIIGTHHQCGGQASTTTTYGIYSEANAENVIINSAHFDTSSRRVKSQIAFHNSVKNGIVDDSIMEVTGTVSGSAKVIQGSSSSVLIGRIL